MKRLVGPKQTPPALSLIGWSVCLMLSSAADALAEDVSKTPLTGNVTPHQVSATQKMDLHQTLRKETSESGTTAKQAKEAAETARTVNQLPGEKVDSRDLEHAPIKGFHPLKKIFAPVSNLETSAVKLNKEATKLEKPMGDLQAPMVDLQKKMVNVDTGVGHMQKRLNSVADQVTGARTDLHDVREEIDRVKKPIKALQGPVTGIARPLEQIQQKLNLLLLFIVIFIGMVSFGTPLVAIMLYRKRAKIFGAQKPIEHRAV